MEQNWVSDPLIMNRAHSKKSDNSCQSVNVSAQENCSIASSFLEKKNDKENNENRPKQANIGSNAAEREDN